MSEWGGMSIRGLFFQWSSTIQIQLSVLVLYNVDLVIISLNINLFSPWYSGVGVKYNHSLTLLIYISDTYSRVMKLKLTNPKLKVLLAIGGWSHPAAPFTKVVSSDSNIDLFSHNAINFLRARGFDGLDLDWEYPANRGSPQGDKARFSRFVSVSFISQSNL